MTQRQISRLLAESGFNPKKPGPMKIISEIDNIDYYRGKAIELINTSILSNKPHDCLRDAISVLILARCLLEKNDVSI